MNKKDHKCPHNDDGWCRAVDCKHNACPETWNCDYFKKVVRKVLWGEQKKDKDDE